MGLVGKFMKHAREDGLGEAVKITAAFLDDRRLGPYLVDGGSAAPVCRGAEPDSGFERADGTPRILVQAHIFFPQDADEIARNLACIPYAYDLLVSTDTPEKQAHIQKRLDELCTAQSWRVDVLPNHGRDVLPFATQVREVIDRYDYLMHLHSKHSGHTDWGDFWREYLYSCLLGTRGNVAQIFSWFERDAQLGIVFPERYPFLMAAYRGKWGRHRAGIRTLLDRCGFPEAQVPEREQVFPAGTMFWARTGAVRQIFEPGVLRDEEFAEEAGQVEKTIAHTVERVWAYLAQQNGCTHKKVLRLAYAPGACEAVSPHDATGTVCILAQGGADERFARADAAWLDELESLGSQVLTAKRGEGPSFGAWRDALLANEGSVRDAAKLVLASDGFLPPLVPLRRILESAPQGCGAWSVSSIAQNDDGPRRLRSDLVVFGREALRSDAFWGFWHDMDPKAQAAQLEKDLSEALEVAGIERGTWCAVTESFTKNVVKEGAAAYPYEAVILGNPLIDKGSLACAQGNQAQALAELLAQLPEDASPAAKAAARAWCTSLEPAE